MKAALCISGELRSYDKTYAELKNNIIDPLGADVFVYSWDAVKGTRKARCQVNKYNRFLVDLGAAPKSTVLNQSNCFKIF